jgi:hypothetical protein
LSWRAAALAAALTIVGFCYWYSLGPLPCAVALLLTVLAFLVVSGSGND